MKFDLFFFILTNGWMAEVKRREKKEGCVCVFDRFAWKLELNWLVVGGVLILKQLLIPPPAPLVLYSYYT